MLLGALVVILGYINSPTLCFASLLLLLTMRAHRASLQCGIICLKRLNYDWRLLQHRRDESSNALQGCLLQCFV